MAVASTFSFDSSTYSPSPLPAASRTLTTQRSARPPPTRYAARSAPARGRCARRMSRGLARALWAWVTLHARGRGARAVVVVELAHRPRGGLQSGQAALASPPGSPRHQTTLRGSEATWAAIPRWPTKTALAGVPPSGGCKGGLTRRHVDALHAQAGGAPHQVLLAHGGQVGVARLLHELHRVVAPAPGHPAATCDTAASATSHKHAQKTTRGRNASMLTRDPGRP